MEAQVLDIHTLNGRIDAEGTTRKDKQFLTNTIKTITGQFKSSRTNTLKAADGVGTIVFTRTCLTLIDICVHKRQNIIGNSHVSKRVFL